MSDERDVTFNLKAVINKQRNKVLFAEVDKEFADVLLSFMTIPLGRIVQLLGKHYGENTPVIGSLNTLYNGVENLDCSHFKSYDDHKLMLLNPKSGYASPFRNMRLCFYGAYESTDHRCGKAFKGNFIEDNKSSFIVSDDLRVVPVKLSVENTIQNVGISMADLDGAETRNVTVDVDKFMDFLKGSLLSSHALTDIILGTKWMNSTPEKFEPLSALSGIKKEIISNFETTDLIAVFEKSTHKFLFAHAQQDFVDFLFSLLLISLGRVHIFIGTTGFNNIDNLYMSIDNHFDKDLLNGAGNTRDWLLGIISFTKGKSWLASNTKILEPIFLINRSRDFIVTDDLSVTPFSLCSTLSLLNQMKISPSDVQEVAFKIGYEEALNILKASLTSTSALTNGLINQQMDAVTN